MTKAFGTLQPAKHKTGLYFMITSIIKCPASNQKDLINGHYLKLYGHYLGDRWTHVAPRENIHSLTQ